MSSFAPERTEYGNDDTRWLRDALRAETHGKTIDGDLWTSDAAGVLVPSGTHVSALGGPYNSTTEEVVTLTEGGAGLTSFTITFGGQTTASLDDDATAAQVQAALEALSTIGEGNVEVTGGPLATAAFSVKFVGDLANTNVGDVTTTPTGGTGTVDVAVGTAGGSAVDSPAGSGVTDGHLRDRIRVKPGRKYLVSLVHAGTVDRRYLPAGNHDAAAEADLTAVAYIN